MKALLWILFALAGAAAHAADEASIDITGNLVAPPCVPRFPSSQQLDLGDVSLGQLAADSAVSTDVPLVFDCRAGTRVTLKLSPGQGSADRQTLLTDRANLGLRLNLLHNSSQTDFSLGADNAWLLADAPLALNLRVKPVALDEPPEAGSYSALVLMEMTYL
ncbi:Pilin (type 1 fimbria component protein) [Pseudomonas cuatrocienegasensis]|uniref:Pilin (Type 1 fimbria component protein) n=1 Tax=Pseudomonas cuatrocienegasensis TaxID=543360 RepID=A0ABY1BPJ9_9PSED|nr:MULTISPECIES: fimbrial protein [Pseudomonas]OEC33763.1 fimbrial protein [Pseudomonas sp. 21C1]SER31953.1 Pilin (type 1 fimbria component protein) [Pseudomonas cuatrocienegasensis]